MARRSSGGDPAVRISVRHLEPPCAPAICSYTCGKYVEYREWNDANPGQRPRVMHSRALARGGRMRARALARGRDARRAWMRFGRRVSA